jgi:hypothetical protein
MDRLVPDLVRKDFYVPDLSEQKKYIDLKNEGKPAAMPRISTCPR